MTETSSPSRFQQVISLVDEANAEDPRREVWAGEEHPKEALYSQRMSAWLERLQPDASEGLRIAARAQHLRRWEIPRSEYSAGRTGYLRWRSDLSRFHADLAAGFMARSGYSPAEIEQVRNLLQKKRLKHDPEAQTLEDVACLVFLEFYFTDFAPAHDDEKLIDILRKTWKKMSPVGHQAASTLVLPQAVEQLLAQALQEH